MALPGPWGLRRRAQCTIFHREAGASACLCLVQSQRAKSEFLLCLYWLHDLFFFFKLFFNVLQFLFDVDHLESLY